jgi:sugar phosphate isomerase/epimerase
MVVGGLPSGSRDLVGARHQVADLLAELAPYAADYHVRLVLEPLHPMYCADRAVISTLRQALDLAAPHAPTTVGVVVDTFHVWWDPDLQSQIARAGAEHRLACYQICDWNLPIAQDALLSRGMMGDGYIDFDMITQWIANTGYTGDVEVEIFNEDIWAADGNNVIATMIDRYLDLVLPSLTLPSDTLIPQ